MDIEFFGEIFEEMNKEYYEYPSIIGMRKSAGIYKNNARPRKTDNKGNLNHHSTLIKYIIRENRLLKRKFKRNPHFNLP